MNTSELVFIKYFEKDLLEALNFLKPVEKYYILTV